MSHRESIASRVLSSSELAQVHKELDVYGYATVPGYFDAEVSAQFLALVNSAYEKVNSAGKVAYPGVPSRDDRDKILYNLHNVDNRFIDLLTTDGMRSIAMKRLNDPWYRFLPEDCPNYVLAYYNARSSGSKLDFHIDSHIPFAGSFTNMMQFAVLLEPSTEENGCTIVVPGSHKSGTYTDRDLGKYTALTGRPGDLVCWDSRLWHGTLENRTGASRWALIATMSMWWVKPAMDIVRGVDDSIYQGCSAEQKQLLGFCSIPPTDPLERVNTKCGYDFLKPSVKDYGL